MKCLRRLLIILLVSVFMIHTVSTVYALDLDNSGNGAGSQNSIDVNVNNSNSVKQSGNANVDTNVDSNPNTGGNKASGNNGGATVQTGDSYSQTTVNNTFNNNQATIKCCEGKVTPTQPKNQPTPTSVPGSNNGGNGGSSNNSSNGSSSSGGTGGTGEILGLSATSGMSENVFYAAGFVCLLIASMLYRKEQVLKK